MTLKASPPCTRNNGREIYFTVKRNAEKLRITYPDAYLDKACGADANEQARKAWVAAQKPALLAALAQNTHPDTAILIEEIT